MPDGAIGGFHVQENIFIPLPDGNRLAARLWLPDTAATQPAAAIIEYVPYRKRDQTRSRDEPIHAWFAARGYACLRVDMRGSGDSTGVLRQEFQRQEQDDALDMIAWVAAQSWCDGDVVMLGKSWGAYAAMQVALRRPPALKAIIPVCGGDDRYDQSLHFTGGAILVETLWWSDIMMLFNMRPPDPAISGDAWETLWRARLEDNTPWIGEWLRHQRRDAFWQHASLSDNPGAVACAVFAVGGWADYISRSVPRMMASLQTPRWGLVGPWGHHYPHDGIPGPAIDFLGECARFLDTALRGGPGYADIPMLRAWIGAWQPPASTHVPAAGRFVAEKQWPSPRIQPRILHLNGGTLDDAPKPEAALLHRSPLTIGHCAPEWLSQGLPGEAPMDQRPDDGQSLCFDTAPLSETVEILGSVVLELDLAVNQPCAMIAARVNDIAPDGTSRRVVLGVLNLTHRESDTAPTPMPPGERVRVRLMLPEVGYGFAPGHRIRIALSTSYWPIVWPSPAPVTLTLFTGASQVMLPVRPPAPEDATLCPFDPPQSAAATPMTILEPPHIRRSITQDLITGTHILEVTGDGGFLGPGRRIRLDDTGTTLGHTIRKRCMINTDDPLSACADYAQTMELERGDWRILLETSTRMTSSATAFNVEASLRASSGGVVVHERAWRIEEKRDFV